MGLHIHFTVRVPDKVTGRLVPVKHRHKDLNPEVRMGDLYGLLGCYRYENFVDHPAPFAGRGWPADTTGCEYLMDGWPSSPSFALLSELRFSLAVDYGDEDIVKWLDWLAHSPTLELVSGGQVPNPGSDQIQIVWGFG